MPNLTDFNSQLMACMIIGHLKKNTHVFVSVGEKQCWGRKSCKRVSWYLPYLAYSTPSIYAEGKIAFIFPFVCSFIHVFVHSLPLGHAAQSVGHLAHKSGVLDSYPVWQHAFVSPSAFSRRAVVSYWRSMCTKYWLTA